MATTVQLNEQRQQALARMVAQGTDLAEAAQALNLSMNSARAIARSPLFGALVARYQKEATVPSQERLLQALEGVIENEVIPRLRELIQSERDTTALSAARTTAELYKSLKAQDNRGMEATVNIVLSESETRMLHSLVDMPEVIVPEFEVIPTATQLAAELLEMERADSD